MIFGQLLYGSFGIDAQSSVFSDLSLFDLAVNWHEQCVPADTLVTPAEDMSSWAAQAEAAQAWDSQAVASQVWDAVNQGTQPWEAPIEQQNGINRC
jgi:hypothetical protein